MPTSFNKLPLDGGLERRPGWEAKNLRLYYLLAYCPHLNPIEGMWCRLKGYLMPRHFYGSPWRS